MVSFCNGFGTNPVQTTALLALNAPREEEQQLEEAKAGEEEDEEKPTERVKLVRLIKLKK